MFKSKYWGVEDWDCYGRTKNEYAWNDNDGLLCTRDDRTANLFKLLDALYEIDSSVQVNLTYTTDENGNPYRSGYRDEYVNSRVSEEPNSYHIRGCAADIHFGNHDYSGYQLRDMVVTAASWFPAVKVGDEYKPLVDCLGIGVYDGWVHVDTRGYTSRW